MARKVLRQIEKRRPDLVDETRRIHAVVAAPRTRMVASPPSSVIPVDAESRLSLLKRDSLPTLLDSPVWPNVVREALVATVQEHRVAAELEDRGVRPTRSLLLEGPPGTGKTLAAKWLASELALPLLALDLSAVMSSFLGRTGNNIRVVLDYAKAQPSLLLLDEFDAIAKRRDDLTEIGELKRLVTVLLQEIDDWPSGGLLVAATNHPELLDRAIWRRFDRVVRFPLPSLDELRQVLEIGLKDESIPATTVQLMALSLQGQSFADATRFVEARRREAIVKGLDLNEVLLTTAHAVGGSKESEIAMALAMVRGGVSQREATRLTGVARDTIRKRLAQEGEGG